MPQCPSLSWGMHYNEITSLLWDEWIKLSKRNAKRCFHQLSQELMLPLMLPLVCTARHAGLSKLHGAQPCMALSWHASKDNVIDDNTVVLAWQKHFLLWSDHCMSWRSGDTSSLHWPCAISPTFCSPGLASLSCKRTQHTATFPRVSLAKASHVLCLHSSTHVFL